jgi:hypothetical protein
MKKRRGSHRYCTRYITLPLYFKRLKYDRNVLRCNDVGWRDLQLIWMFNNLYCLPRQVTWNLKISDYIVEFTIVCQKISFRGVTEKPTLLVITSAKWTSSYLLLSVSSTEGNSFVPQNTKIMHNKDISQEKTEKLVRIAPAVQILLNCPCYSWKETARNTGMFSERLSSYLSALCNFNILTSIRKLPMPLLKIDMVKMDNKYTLKRKCNYLGIY